IEELRSKIDRSQFDLDALLDKLDYDPDQIISFVTDEIAFEQYPGVLRGAQGTLMSRAGNALDQCILLATLLKNAGADARIARATLSQEDARRLLDRMFLPHPPRSPAGDLKAMEEVIGQAGGNGGEPGAESAASISDFFSEVGNQQKDFRATALQITADFQERLKAAGIALGDPEMSRKLVTEAQDYFWVEYRLTASGPWETVHPAFGKDASPNVQKMATIQDSIPQELQQRVRFDVEIEQQLNGQLTRKKVMATWERPTANLIGVQMSYASAPSGVEHAEDFADPSEVARKSNFFIPVFNGNVAPGAQFFDLDGVTIPPEAAGSPASGVFKQVGEKTESAASALSGLGAMSTPGEKQADIRSLTGAWLTYTLIAPGENEKSIRRTLFDPVGTDRRKGDHIVGSVGVLDPVQATLALAQRVTFMVSPCDYPDAYILDRGLEQLLHARLMWQTLLDLQYGKSTAEASQDAWKSAQKSPEFMLFPIIQAFLHNSPNMVSYVATPSIIGSWSGISSENDQLSEFFATDIVYQGRRTLQAGADGPQAAVNEAMMSGIWASVNERFAALAGGLNSVTPVGAIDTLRSAKQNAVRMVVITPKNQAAVSSLNVPKTMRSSIHAALTQGYAVVTPERVAAGMFPGWWRVDPLTGATLGMGPQGRGVELTMEVLFNKFLNVLILATSIALNGVAICIRNGCEHSVCFTEAVKGWLSGMFLGVVLELLLPIEFALVGEPKLFPKVFPLIVNAAEKAHAWAETGHNAMHVIEWGEHAYQAATGECPSESE
ncbi:MAG: hypothetical protein WAM60_03270, partial [Candidatus Promineifilaceae bacterium]